MMTETTLWGIHAGSTGDADSLFLSSSVVALGWDATGNIGELPQDREAFKKRVLAAYPHTKEGAIPTTAGMLYRFVYEMKEGDAVAYPSKKDRMIHLGRIIGQYVYTPNA
ncbi:MAG: hypothetical protein SFX74_03170, partial [Fimbriimonadaceae bacterium]|nr:hypothetical protein [Fimbriimonadaceae bacterium]